MFSVRSVITLFNIHIINSYCAQTFVVLRALRELIKDCYSPSSTVN